MKKKKVRMIMQMNRSENGAAVLTSILHYFKKYTPLSEVRDECTVSRMNTSQRQLVKAGEHFGLTCTVREHLSVSDVKVLPLPAVLSWGKNQYVILCGTGRDRYYLGDPAKGNVTRSAAEFSQKFSGTALLFAPGPDFRPEGERPSVYRSLLRRLGEYKNGCVLTVLFHTLSIVTAAAAIAVNRHFVDNVLEGGDPAMEPLLTAVIVSLLVLRVVLSAGSTLFSNTVSEKVSARSGSALYQKLLHLPVSFFETHAGGDILDRIEMSSTIDRTFLKTALPKFIDALMTVFYAVMLFFYDPVIGAGCLLFEIFYVVIAGKIRDESAVLSGNLLSTRASENSMTLNMLNTIETIKTIGAEREFYGAWAKTNREVTACQDRRMVITSAGDLVKGLLNAVSSSLLLFISSVFIIRGNFTLGMLSSVQSLLSHLRQNLTGAVSAAENIERLSVTADRVTDIMNRKEDVTVPLAEDAKRLTGEICVNDVGFRYNKGDDPVLEHISFSVKPGEFVALVGLSGGGKSTLLKILSGLYVPESGMVTYDKKTRSEIPDAVFTSSLAVVEQEPVPFKDTVENNLKLKDDMIEDYEMILAANDAAIHQRILASPGGYQSEIAENGRNFSGGEVQRLELAAALSRDPSILLLDEFTSALDAETERNIFHSLRTRRAVTCILVAHRYSTLTECDRVIVIKDGRIAEEGTPEALYAAGGEFTGLVNSR